MNNTENQEQYNYGNGTQQQVQMPHGTNQPMKNSKLSVTALVFSILGCLCIVGLILAIIDLAKKDKTEKHTLSIVAIVLCVVWIVIGVAVGGNTDTSSKAKTPSPTITSEQSEESEVDNKSESDSDATVTEPESEPESEEESQKTEDTLTMAQKNALDQADNYLSFTAFSHSGLIEQLEYEGYTTEDATYAADNCGADWNEQAAKKAQDYLDMMSFSRDGLIEQLEFEGFTAEEAEYGVTAVGY